MKKKIAALLLAVAMLAVAVIGGTLAYFTDTEDVDNEFTVGSVDITVEEDFPNNEDILPGIEYVKSVTVKNVGRSSAYLRVILTFPQYLNPVWSDFVGEGKVWNLKDEAKDLDGNTIYTLWYNGTLKASDTTDPCLKAVYIDKWVDDELNLKDAANTGSPKLLNVIVNAESIQSKGFASAEEAFLALDAQILIDADNASLVTTADELVEALESGKDVVLEEDVKIDPANMSNAYGTTGINVKNGQAIDGNGKTLDIQGAGGTWDSGISTTGGLIQNITVTGSFRGIFINHNSAHSEPVVLENVIITGTTYTISCDQGKYQGLTANNSEFYGWTSYAATLGNAKFSNCKFAEGSGYAYMRPYAPTEFVNCEFEAGFEMDARAAVTFENCTIGGVLITAENVGTLVTSNTSNASVK